MLGIVLPFLLECEDRVGGSLTGTKIRLDDSSGAA